MHVDGIVLLIKTYCFNLYYVVCAVTCPFNLPFAMLEDHFIGYSQDLPSSEQTGMGFNSSVASNFLTAWHIYVGETRAVLSGKRFIMPFPQKFCYNFWSDNKAKVST